MEKVFKNCIIISNGQFILNKAIIISKGIIKKIVNMDDIPPHGEQFDMQGTYVCSGFLDLQIMGVGGALFGSLPSVQNLEIMEEELLKLGTIGFLPTVSTNSEKIIQRAITSAIKFRNSSKGSFLGLHLEGPYINPINRGAHPVKYIKKATIDEVTELLGKSNGEIRMMTLAPELQETEIIKYLDKKGVVVAMGHTGANYEEALCFLQGKKKAVTHLFNGMPQIHHRNPGLIPAVFRQKPYTSIIADGIHVSYPMLIMAKEILGEYLYLISDAATPTSTGEYQHTFRGDRYVKVNSKDGSEMLSGSALTMLKAIQNCVTHAGISLPEAVNMATLYPARVLAIEGYNGVIKEGYAANLVFFDKDYIIREVIFKGNKVDIK